MVNIGHSKFFWNILVQKDWKKYGTAKTGCSEFFQTILVLKDEKKFGTAKTGCSKLFQTILVQKKLEGICNGQNWAFPIFWNHFGRNTRTQILVIFTL